MSLQDQVTEVYLEARDDVYRYLLTFGLAPHQAQDATQEVFLRLFLTLKEGNAIRNARAWVFRVAHNLGADTRKKESALRPLDPEVEPSLPAGGANQEQALLDSERDGRLRKALDGLSPQQRQCLYLRAEGLRYHEIAETLGVGISTVGEFLSRALRKLRKAVDE